MYLYKIQLWNFRKFGQETDGGSSIGYGSIPDYAKRIWTTIPRVFLSSSIPQSFISQKFRINENSCNQSSNNIINPEELRGYDWIKRKGEVTNISST
ncbi:MAG: hypothetical protein NTX61_10330 [Bacteroidetes bacterium]|nr:hypothetical protein [Bacteroidota bacterium]